MNELIKLSNQTINDTPVNTVSARELHKFIGSKQDFSTWIKNRIEKYGFVENQDFIVFHKIVENPQGGRPSREYHITLDMAKQLAMVENNDMGMQARKYFIECEKQLKTQTQQPVAISQEEAKLKTVLLLSQHLSIKDKALETFLITSTEKIIGVELPYRPQIERKTYSAKEIANQLGITANKVGRIANDNNLKTDDYGMYYLSKSEHSDKQVETWRYYDTVIDVMKSLLN